MKLDTLLKNGRTCWLCGLEIPMRHKSHGMWNMLRPTRDHLLPRSKGGTNRHGLALAHLICNQIRGDEENPNEKTKARCLNYASRFLAICKMREQRGDNAKLTGVSP